MIGFGRIFKGAAGQDRAKVTPTVPISTVYRALSVPKASLPAEAECLPSDEDAGDTRSGKRFVPRRTSVTITMQSGKKVSGRIINVSQTGVAVEADFAAVGRDAASRSAVCSSSKSPSIRGFATPRSSSDGWSPMP